MASLHTGSKDILLYIETDLLNVTIKGKTVLPIVSPEEDSSYETSIKIYSKDNISQVDIKNEKCVEDLSSVKNWFYSTEHKMSEPLFYEQESYEILIEVAKGYTALFNHENKNIRESVTANKKQNILSGIINFHNEIGLSNFMICLSQDNSDYMEYLEFIIEVFPSKISYKDDYEAILNDIKYEVYNLVFDFLKRTYHTYQAGKNKGNSPVEFLAILQQIYDDFLKSTDRILSHPHHQLQVTHEIAPAHKIKRTDNQTLHWIEMHPDQAKKKNGKVYAERALSVKKRVSYNTNENRLAKHMLLMTIKRLDDFKNKYNLLKREKDYVVIEQIDEMIKQLKWRCNTSFMAEVESFGNTSEMSLVFSMAPGYKELYKYYIMLQRGLSVTGDVFNISQKDLAVLYEYWCFIKLNSILRDQYELNHQDIIKTRGNRLFVSLTKGKQSKVEYINPKNNEHIILTYNKKIESGIPTVVQKPDNILELIKEGSCTYKYVFDSKYKVTSSKVENEALTTLCPEEEDINTMHRYRDAIVASGSVYPFERSMFGAYVLFPAHDENTYEKHAFYKSIEKVNIGGLPFLPHTTRLVKELLNDLIADSPDTAFERTTLPLGIEERLARIDWSVRDVLIVNMHNPKQWEKFQNNNCCYVQASLLKKSDFPIHYIAICQYFNKTAGIEYFGEVTECIPDQDQSLNPTENFYLFEVKSWNKLNRNLRTSKYARAVEGSIEFTNKFLLDNSTEISELQIQSEAEYRFYCEIKRIMDNISIHKNRTGIFFQCNDTEIDFRKGQISAYRKGQKSYSEKIETFIKEPGAKFRELKEYILKASN